MKRSILAAMVGLGLALVSTTDAAAQLHNFPNYAVPSSFGMPSSVFSVDYGRGLNDNGMFAKRNAYGVAYARTGIGERVNVAVGAGMVDLAVDNKYTFGGALGFDILDADSDTQIALQGGLGYMSIADQVSSLNIPIGVAVKGTQPGESMNFGWWFMPRLDMNRASAFGVSNTNTDIGASAGVSLTTASGFGVHVAADLLAADQSVWTGGVGLHYVVN